MVNWKNNGELNMIQQITDHAIKARRRLLEQYKGNPELEAILNSFNAQVQELENTIVDLNNRLDLYAISGALLDAFGTIVGQPRLNYDDTFYRILLLIKIGKNTSQGTPENAIQIYKLITQATKVQYQELYPAGVFLMSDGFINPVTASFVYENIGDVLPAGVRLDHFGQYEPSEAFAFEGDPATTDGFSEIASPLEGGQFAGLFFNDVPFAFAGNDLNAQGFGSWTDPVEGGAFVSL